MHARGTLQAIVVAADHRGNPPRHRDHRASEVDRIERAQRRRLDRSGAPDHLAGDRDEDHRLQQGSYGTQGAVALPRRCCSSYRPRQLDGGQGARHEPPIAPASELLPQRRRLAASRRARATAVREARRQELSLAQIALCLGVTRGRVQQLAKP